MICKLGQRYHNMQINREAKTIGRLEVQVPADILIRVPPNIKINFAIIVTEEVKLLLHCYSIRKF